MRENGGKPVSRKREAVHALHLLALSSFAVAQPLYELLGRHAAFFVAHDVRRLVLGLWVVVVAAGVPLVLLGLEWAAGRINSAWRVGLQRVWVGGLVTAIALPLLHRAELPAALALVPGALAAFVYARAAVFRTFLTVASVGAVVFPIWFLAGTPVRAIAFPEPPAAAHDVPKPGRVPPVVVFVIFDGLRLIDLIDAQERIDRVRFPNFGSLADRSTWYRNATTVAEFTMFSLPAILTGQYPVSGSNLEWPMVATAETYPRNLFTLLAGAYELRVREPATGLCPTELCPEEEGWSGVTARLGRLLADTAVIYLHVLLPPSVADARLPGLEDRWAGFVSFAAPEPAPPGRDRRRPRRHAELFAEFVSRIGRGSKPTLHFLHSQLSHFPNRHLPSGAIFNAPPIQDVRGWTRMRWLEDEMGALQAEKRYLMQLGFVDTLLGQLLLQLEATGLEDEALIVVTSDHGWAFRAGHASRIADEATAADILPVPLFIKAPGQRQGRVDDRPVETVDILPTLAELLEIELPWPVDGSSLIARGDLERTGRTLCRRGNRIQRPSDEVLWREALPEKLRRFGARTPLEDVLAAGPLQWLVGRRLSELDARGTASYSVEIAEPELYAAVDPDSGFVPAFVHGRVEPVGDEMRRPLLVIAVNGVVSAVTNAYATPRGERRFQALVAESVFQPGANRVEIFTVAAPGGRIQLRRPRSGGSTGEQ